MKELNELQLEVAAKKYCEIMCCSPGDGWDGERWRVIAIKIRELHIMNMCIDYAISHVSEEFFLKDL